MEGGPADMTAVANVADDMGIGWAANPPPL